VGRTLLKHLIKSNKYDITLFNRGITNPELFPTIKRICGDRKNKKDLKLISSKDWDCVMAKGIGRAIDPSKRKDR